MNEPDYREAARKLWMLLDDIDTLDDVCRADDAAFRKHARSVQRKRFDVLSGEQFDALSASPSTPENAEKDTSNASTDAACACGVLCLDRGAPTCRYTEQQPTPCPECHNANGHYDGCGRGFGTSWTTDGVKEVPRG